MMIGTKWYLLLLMYSTIIAAKEPDCNCGLAKDPKLAIENLQNINKILVQNTSKTDNVFLKACKPSLPESTSEGNTQQAVEASIAKNLLILQSIKDKPTNPSSIPKTDKVGRKTQDFLLKVHERIAALHEGNRTMAKGILDCTNEPPLGDCTEINSWLKSDFQTIVAVARLDLAMAKPEHKLFGSDAAEDDLPNLQLSTKAGQKDLAWLPLNKDESNQIKSDFIDMQKMAREKAFKDSEISKTHPKEAYYNNLSLARNAYNTTYLGFMGLTPIVQFIESPNPTNKEIHNAAQKVLDQIDIEKKHLDSLYQDLLKPPLKKLTVLNLMRYQTDFEIILFHNPQFCGIALNLREIMGNRELAKGLAAVIGLVSTFYFSWPAAMVMAATTTGFFTYDAYEDFSKRDNIEKSRVFRGGYENFKKITNSGKKTELIQQEIAQDITQFYVNDLKELKTSRETLKTNLIMTSVGFVALPAAIKFGSYFKANMDKVFKLPPPPN